MSRSYYHWTMTRRTCSSQAPAGRFRSRCPSSRCKWPENSNVCKFQDMFTYLSVPTQESLKQSLSITKLAQFTPWHSFQDNPFSGSHGVGVEGARVGATMKAVPAAKAATAATPTTAKRDMASQSACRRANGASAGWNNPRKKQPKEDHEEQEKNHEKPQQEAISP